MVVTERTKCSWHWLLKDGVNGSSLRNLGRRYCLEELSLHSLSGLEKHLVPTLWTSQIRASPECQGGKAKRPCRKKAQISGETWFVMEWQGIMWLCFQLNILWYQIFLLVLKYQINYKKETGPDSENMLVNNINYMTTWIHVL